MSDEEKAALLKQMVPSYTKLEEMINYMSHFVGMIFGVFTLIFFINHHINHPLSLLKFTSLIVYSVSMITLYFISFLYHFISPASIYKRLLRKMDHDKYLLYGMISFVSYFKQACGKQRPLSVWIRPRLRTETGPGPAGSRPERRTGRRSRC